MPQELLYEEFFREDAEDNDGDDEILIETPENSEDKRKKKQIKNGAKKIRSSDVEEICLDSSSDDDDIPSYKPSVSSPVKTSTLSAPPKYSRPSLDFDLSLTAEDEIEFERNLSESIEIDYLGKTEKLTCKRGDKFANIMSQIAELFKLEVSKVSLKFKGKKVLPTSDLISLDYQLGDCFILYYSDQKKKVETESGSGFKLYFKGNDDKQKFAVEGICPEMKISELIKKVAAAKNVPPHSIKLKFEDEVLKSDKDVNSCDLMDEDLIEIKYL